MVVRDFGVFVHLIFIITIQLEHDIAELDTTTETCLYSPILPSEDSSAQADRPTRPLVARGVPQEDKISAYKQVAD